MDIELSWHYHRLPFVGVLLQILDEHQQHVGVSASGFIRREKGRLYLYTCWHVVTAFDMYDVRVPAAPTLPERRFLRVSLQNTASQPGLDTIGGLQSLDLELYEPLCGGTLGGLRPRWDQDEAHVPHEDLNNIGLHVPYWHDLVRLELPATLAVHQWQVVDEDRIAKAGHIVPGEKCVVVGFPHGYSAFGEEQPTPVVLVRFAASDRVQGRPQCFLLDSIGAPGMSGAPVFVERGSELLLAGIYSGAIYPSGPRLPSDPDRQRVTDLGVVSNLALTLAGAFPLVRSPCQALERRKAQHLIGVVTGLNAPRLADADSQ
jgi:hypothetical protein